MFIRHADRDGVMNALVGSDERLNEAGIRRAKHLGRQLKRFRRISFSSSPVPRCVDTCSCIAEGHGSEADIEKTEFLGMQSDIMLQPRECYVIMRSMGLERFIDEYTNDKIDPKVTVTCQQGSQMIYSYGLRRMRETEADLVVLVTHDMILTPGLVKYFGFDHRRNGLVSFLDGEILYPVEGGYEVIHNGHKLRVDANCLPPC
jgi:hypothetical protein